MTTLSLAGTWTLRDAAGGETIACPIPGDVYSALLAAQKIPDPYHGRNELVVQWPGEKDWVLERTVSVTAAQLARSEAWLTIEGLDTVAELSLNGVPFGSADNQFRRWQFEVRKHLKVGDNHLMVVLRSANQEAAKRAKRLPYAIPWTTNNTIPHLNLLRKTQCHGGWDWGISLMVSGIYQRIDLTFVDTVRLDYVYSVQRHEPGRCHVAVSTEVYSPSGGEVSLTVELDGKKVMRQVRVGAGANVLTTEMVVEQPKLWWPNGHGAQPLYDLTVTIGDQSKTRRIGLRTIELINQPDERGISMTFRINGRDIFCKGANWIPADAMPSRETEQRFGDLLDSAVAAHMNMIRVWGGGQFERDRFYEMCDEKGLMIWHDMMFSCALYPADREFLANVRAETLHQIKRLRDHASIALWCGDNECVGALGWYPESKAARERFVINWARLNQTLADAISEADPSRVFWPSSPCSGPGDFSDGWHDDTKGDMHYWDVWHGGKGMEAYFSIKPRFCSEFGYQSFSSPDVAKAFCPPDHWNITSPTMELHQKNPGGNTKINEMFARYFRMPVGFENTLWLSQVQQALAIKLGVEFWRHQMPTCMGTLYWQLNDNWPVASWSSIEYGGKWKQLHHHARRFFQSAIVTAFQTKDTVQIWAVNDQGQPCQATVSATVYDLEGKALETLTFTAAVPANSSVKLAEHPVARLAGDQRDRRFLVMDLKGSLGGQAIVHRNVHVFTEYKRYDLADPKITATVAEVAKTLTVTMKAAKPAFFCTLNADGIAGEFSDNSVVMLPGQDVTVTFSPKQAGVTAESLRQALSVMHLQKSYQLAAG